MKWIWSYIHLRGTNDDTSCDVNYYDDVSYYADDNIDDDVNNLSVVGVDVDDLHSHEFLHLSIFIFFLYYPVS